jgi:hypothetical protein
MKARIEPRPTRIHPYPFRLFALAGALALAACADDAMMDGDVHLRPGGDVISAARVSEVREAVPGDVMVFGETATFDGEAGGSAIAAGRDVEVRGHVDGSIRSAGATVVIHATVDRNLTAAGGRVLLDEEAVIAGNAYLAGGEVRVDGTVDGDLYVGANSAIVDGVVGGDVRVEAHTLRLGPEARIEGELRYRIDEDGAFVTDASSRIAGDTEALTRRDPDGRPDFGFLVGRVLAFLAAGAVVVALLPGTLATLVDPIEHRPGASAAYGFVTMLVAPIGVVVLAATMVGIPLAVTAVLLMGLAWYFAPVVPAVWLGSEMLGIEPVDTTATVKAFLVGGSVVALASVSPWIGFPVHLIATAFGLGAIALAVRAHRKGKSHPAPDG